ncbi:hypothetical protein SELMODRAFT_412801 [Selaginella moellendorffii]|uniref:Uncharacterized protein n=1 Tax=Selaginella moellendorffii TaxID=88036 RepID=D8RMC2_SELML|nr:hypothetical protein SELMODRAFT_412801 [Selaginella moellendorffii]
MAIVVTVVRDYGLAQEEVVPVEILGWEHQILQSVGRKLMNNSSWYLVLHDKELHRAIRWRQAKPEALENGGQGDLGFDECKGLANTHAGAKRKGQERVRVLARSILEALRIEVVGVVMTGMETAVPFGTRMRR